MNKIEINEYIRTNEGIIAKLVSINKLEQYRFDNIVDTIEISDVLIPSEFSCIKNHSFRLADLAEPGDIGVMNCYGFLVKKFLTKDDIFELRTENYELLEILTKEQFENGKYVGGKLI